MIKTSLEAFNSGNGMTDQQLNLLLNHYRRLVELLEPLGAKYFLATSQAKMELSCLEWFHFHRSHNGDNKLE